MNESSDAPASLPWPKVRAARFAVAAVFFIHGVALAGFASFLPVIKARLHMSATDVGNAIFFSPMGAVIVLPFLGPLFAKHGTRRVLAWMATGLCLAEPFAIGAQSAWMLKISLLFAGAFGAALDSAMNAEAVEVQRLYPTPIMSSSHGCWSLGGFVGGGFVALTRLISLDPVVHVVIITGVLLIALVFAERHLLPHTTEETESGPALALPVGPLLLIGILMMLSFGSEGAGYDWIAVYLREAQRTTESLAALGFGIFSGAMATSRMLGDLVVHRIGQRNTLVYGGLLAAAGFIAGVSAPNATLAIAGFVVGGFTIANIVPILFQAAGNVEGVATGTGIAAVSTMGYAMFFMAPQLVGRIADHSSLSVGIGVLGAGVLGVAIFGPQVLRRTESSSS